MSDSEGESASGIIDDTPTMVVPCPSPSGPEQLQQRLVTLEQQNRRLNIENVSSKLRVIVLEEENKKLREVKREQEDISSKMLQQIKTLEKEKRALFRYYKNEEMRLANDLKHEKIRLAHIIEQEQEYFVNGLLREIEILSVRCLVRDRKLQKLTQEKLDLLYTFEQEQDAVFNMCRRLEQPDRRSLLQDRVNEWFASREPIHADHQLQPLDEAGPSHSEHDEEERMLFRRERTVTPTPSSTQSGPSSSESASQMETLSSEHLLDTASGGVQLPRTSGVENLLPVQDFVFIMPTAPAPRRRIRKSRSMPGLVEPSATAKNSNINKE